MTARLVLTSFPESGDGPPQHAIYDVYPEGVTPAILSGGVSDAAASPDGTVAVGISYATSLSSDLVEQVLLARLGKPDQKLLWTPPWPTSQLTLWEIAWDGEAFALHFALSNPGLQDWGIRLVRLSPDGTLLSGPDVVADSAVVPHAFAVATDVATGTTLFASPGGLSGHLRDGTPIFPNEPYLSKELVAQGVPAESSKFSGWPAVALDGGEAVVSWAGLGIEKDSYIQPLTNFEPSGAAVVVAAEPEAPWGLQSRVAARTPKGWMLVGAIRAYTFAALEVVDGALASKRDLVEHRSYQTCSKTNTCPGGFPALDLRNLHLVRWQDEALFGFLDYSDNYLDPATHAEPLVAYRIVNAASDCQYRSLYDEHHSGKD